MHIYEQEFITLAVVHFLAVVVPGPDFAITVRQSVRYGRFVGIATALGIGTGISVHVGYTLLGIAALMHTHPWLLHLASLIGAAYLIYLGIKLMLSRRYDPILESSSDEEDLQLSSETSISWSKAYLRGFLTNATNPKATLFFLAIFTTLVSPTTPLWIQSLFGLWMCGVNATWFMLVATLFTVRGVRQTFLRMGHWLERFMGMLLLFFAIRLITLL